MIHGYVKIQIFGSPSIRALDLRTAENLDLRTSGNQKIHTSANPIRRITNAESMPYLVMSDCKDTFMLFRSISVIAFIVYGVSQIIEDMRDRILCRCPKSIQCVGPRQLQGSAHPQPVYHGLPCSALVTQTTTALPDLDGYVHAHPPSRYSVYCSGVLAADIWKKSSRRGCRTEETKGFGLDPNHHEGNDTESSNGSTNAGQQFCRWVR